jgi:hypothetical protein
MGMNFAIETTDEETQDTDDAMRQFAFDGVKADGALETWTVEIVGKSIAFWRNGIGMGDGVIGYESIAAGPSGQRRAQPKVYDRGYQYRVDAAQELWILRQLQRVGAVESDASMQARAISKSRARPGDMSIEVHRA